MLNSKKLENEEKSFIASIDAGLFLQDQLLKSTV